MKGNDDPHPALAGHVPRLIDDLIEDVAASRPDRPTDGGADPGAEPAAGDRAHRGAGRGADGAAGQNPLLGRAHVRAAAAEQRQRQDGEGERPHPCSPNHLPLQPVAGATGDMMDIKVEKVEVKRFPCLRQYRFSIQPIH